MADMGDSAIAQTSARIYEIFLYYCSYGRTSGRGATAHTLDSFNFAKFARDCPGLIDGELVTTTDVDIAFAKSKGPRGRRIGFGQFLDALVQLALKKFPGLEDTRAFSTLVSSYVISGNPDKRRAAATASLLSPNREKEDEWGSITLDRDLGPAFSISSPLRTKGGQFQPSHSQGSWAHEAAPSLREAGPGGHPPRSPMRAERTWGGASPASARTASSWRGGWQKEGLSSPGTLRAQDLGSPVHRDGDGFEGRGRRGEPGNWRPQSGRSLRRPGDTRSRSRPSTARSSRAGQHLTGIGGQGDVFTRLASPSTYTGVYRRRLVKGPDINSPESVRHTRFMGSTSDLKSNLVVHSVAEMLRPNLDSGLSMKVGNAAQAD